MADIGTAVVTVPKRRIRSRTLRRFLRHRPAVVASCILLVFALIAIFAPLLAPYDPIKPDRAKFRP